VRFSGEPTFEGCVDSSIIADKFVQHFKHNNCDRMQALQYEYSNNNNNHLTAVNTHMSIPNWVKIIPAFLIQKI